MPDAGWWTISSRTSRSWCTSEGRSASLARRIVAAVRLTHPFPSLLNAVATTAIASLAGAPPAVAIRLGASMLALQASIGALNDAVDAGADSGRKPGKPIPRGLATPRGAVVLAAASLVVGLALSAPSGIPTLLVAIAGVGIGYAYDLGLSRTPLSWLPLAVALPLLPVHAWLGATGSVPPGLATLVPAAIVAGATLAIANGLVDAERDAAAGRPTLVVHLGARAGGLLNSALAGILVAVAAVAAPRLRGPEVVAGLGSGELLLAAGIAALAAGVVLLRNERADLRERGWELQALGVAAVGIGWLAGTAEAAR